MSQEPARQGGNSARTGMGTDGNITILVADDRAYNRNLVKARLAGREDFQVHEAANGLEALELVRRHRPDIVLTDWLMPGIDGIGLCKEIRSQEWPGYIYIILLTGKEEQNDIVAGLDAGADDYIIKPFHKAELLARLSTGARIVREQRTLRELNALKNKFLGIAAHDLRNPLISIRGAAELVLSGDLGPLNDAQREFLGMIRGAGHDMLDLVNNLLDVSVIESGNLNLGIRRASMARVIEKRLRIYRMHAEAKQIVLRATLEEAPDGYFDAPRMGQVVDNLVSNAIKFSPPFSEVSVVMSLFDQGQAIRVSVWDSGPGFSEEDRARIFGEFQKLSARPTAGEKSSGLGLAIVKKIVEAHGGEVEMESRPGRGAVLGYTMPMTAGGPKPAAGSTAGAKKPRKPRAVVVSGEFHRRAVAATVLSCTNADVVALIDDAEQMETLHLSEPPHLVILDPFLPGGSPPVLVDAARARYPRAVIILLAAGEDDSEVAAALERGADGRISPDMGLMQMKLALKAIWTASGRSPAGGDAP